MRGKKLTKTFNPIDRHTLPKLTTQRLRAYLRVLRARETRWATSDANYDGMSFTDSVEVLAVDTAIADVKLVLSTRPNEA
jgi:hypothetical protein